MSKSSSSRRLSSVEFVPMLAMVNAVVALSIDGMLPALSTIAEELGAKHENDAQLVIFMMFVGFSGGHLFFGPLSDIVGRKRAIYAGTSIFIVGCTISYQAKDFQLMLLGRLLQGLGGASLGDIPLAIVRDQYAGDDMAKIMSMITGVFIIVPALAPSLGLLVLNFAGYRAIFFLLLIHAIVAAAWLALRQPETLPAENRKRFDLRTILNDVCFVAGRKSTVLFTLAQGFVFGNFVAFLSSAPQVFADLYQEEERFPLIFAGLATSVGLASVLNSRIVKRLGMLNLATLGLGIMSSFSFAFLIFVLILEEHPPLWTVLVFFCCVFFQVGFLLGNLNAMAMEPMGEHAGIASAVIGTLSGLTSLTGGVVIGQSYQKTIIPLIIGFFLFSTSALIATRLAEGSRISETQSTTNTAR